MTPLLAPKVARRRWYRFAYHTPGRSDRELLPHQLRDADAALFLQPVLHERGYDYAGPIFNYPARLQPPLSQVPVDESFLKAGDLLVLTTRPPLDDIDDAVKSRVHRGHSTLEAKVLASVRRHLTRCSRANVIVSDIHARAFPQVAKMRNILFRQKKGAPIDKYLQYGSNSWQRPGSDSRRTVAYLIFEEYAWSDGPGILASFGMSGTDTLLWNFHLATYFHELLATVPFVMAELIAPQKVPSQPLTFDFARAWQVRLLTRDAVTQ